MAVAEWRKCPRMKQKRVWIENMERCSESGTCLDFACRYNVKPKQKDRNYFIIAVRKGV
jgi:hypothetical protein